jgi:uncharacterized membrane protein
MGGTPTSENPYSSPAATSAAIQQVKPGALLFSGAVGSVVGAISFAQLISCIGYYVGAFMHGFDRQPPVLYVVAGAFLGVLTGSVCGALAGVWLVHGCRPRLLPVVIICVANTLALLGTIDLSWEISLQSNTGRTIVVGCLCGLVSGVIVSTLLRNRRTA